MNKIPHLESQCKRVLSDIIQNEVKEDLDFITITDCHLTKDLSFLYVYFTLLNKEKLEKVSNGLERAKGFIRTSLVNRVQMRKAPELIFKYDESYEKGTKIESLLREINNK